MSAAPLRIPGGIATPRGFRASGISAGIKPSGNLDLMLLVADAPAQAAAVFTTNKVIAAAVSVSKDHVQRSGGSVRAIVVNRTAETVVRLLPPLVITEADVDEGLARLDAALGAVGAA